MQRATFASTSPASTCFDLDYYEHSADDKEFPATRVLNPHASAANNKPVMRPMIPTVCLSLPPPQNNLRHWRLMLVHGMTEAQTPNHIIGSVVQIAKGRTSQITAFDPVTRRVRTQRIGI